jgi:hypothetical protein
VAGVELGPFGAEPVGGAALVCLARVLFKHAFLKQYEKFAGHPFVDRRLSLAGICVAGMRSSLPESGYELG